jgi:predicted cytidylate kinase
MVKITISGQIGAGKTTVAKMIAKRLNLKFYSIGDLRGKLAIEKGMTIEQLNKVGEKEMWTDKEVDEFQEKFGKAENNFVIEGRVSWFFIPDSIKIFLDVKKEIGAKRIFNDVREDQDKSVDWKDQLQKNSMRISSDKKRYRKYYNIDPYELQHYNIVIDTSDMTPEEVVDEILEKVEKITEQQLKHD